MIVEIYSRLYSSVDLLITVSSDRQVDDVSDLCQSRYVSSHTTPRILLVKLKMKIFNQNLLVFRTFANVSRNNFYNFLIYVVFGGCYLVNHTFNTN